MSGVANLTIEQGAPEELILQTDDNLMALILTDVRGGIQEIRSDQIDTLLTFSAPGDYDAENLSNATVDVEISGSTSATAWVSTTLK